MNDLDAVARLAARVEELEQRLSALEHPSTKTVAVAPKGQNPPSAQPGGEVFSLAGDGGMFSVVGKAMLGIAGAYLLRAVAESGSFPKLAVVCLALAYAGSWLLWAALGQIASFARAIYAATAALILAPMLWELTLRFEVLSASVTAGILAAFLVSAFALAWKRDLVLVAWVASIAAVVTSLALLIATHDLVAFSAALLLMLLACEIADLGNHWLVLRPLVALAADFAVWILLYIYARRDGVPSGYASQPATILLTSGSVLFLICSASMLLRTIYQRRTIGLFETGQCVMAFLLAAFGVLHFGGSSAGVLLGALCLVLAAACYPLAYTFFAYFPERRNQRVYASWGLFLFLAGCGLSLEPLWLASSLSLAAILAVFLGVRCSRITLQLHSLIYLAGAAYASGLLGHASRALVGTLTAAPEWIVWIVAATAVTCYLLVGRAGTGSNRLFLELVFASLAGTAILALLVSVLVKLPGLAAPPSPSQVAVVRTCSSCLFALLLALIGSRWQNKVLVWVAYGTLAWVTAKLIFEDLQYGNPSAIAISIFLYAGALILVPRIARPRRKPTQDSFVASA